jgi:predicted RNase H-like HicB family nuclease
MKFSAVVRKGEKQYVDLCPELDVVTQGPTIDSALENLQEAVELFLEDGSSTFF